MPVMVDPSSGTVLQNNPSVSVYSLSPTSSVSSLDHLYSATMATASASRTISTAYIPIASHGLNQSQIIKNEKAQQAGMDNTTPRNLMIAFSILLVLVMIIAHPRFLARLFASLHRDKQGRWDDYATQGRRHVGGGDLRSGWVLKKGQLPDEADEESWKEDPFADPRNMTSQRRHTIMSIAKPTLSPPPHINPLLQTLPYASSMLMAPFSRLPNPFASSALLPQLFLVVAYLTFVALAMIWKSDISPAEKTSGYGTDYARTGLVALTQLPLVIALGVRGNIIGLCVGKGYERLKFFHKIVGRVLFLAASLHACFYLTKFAQAGTTLQSLKTPFIAAGLVGWLAVLIVGFTSIPWIRQKFYGFFEICHFIGVITLLVGLALHVDVARPFCVASACIYGISLIFSAAKTRVARAELIALPNDTTLVLIPSICTGWRAGQHVRIRVPALGPEGHPFTIASGPGGEGMVLLAKIVGGWTRRLYDYAQGDDEQKAKFANVILEGPYGGLGNTLLPSFSGVLLVAGGSGISQALSLAHDLILRAPSGVIRARIIDLVWIVRTEELVRPLIPTLMDLMNDAKAFEERCLQSHDLPMPVGLRIKVYVSRCPSSSPLTLIENAFADADLVRKPSAAEKAKEAYLKRSKSSRVPITSITAYPGRPDLSDTVDNLADHILERCARNHVDPSGICVTACGPMAMVNDVRRAVRGLEGWKRSAVGGVDLEEEKFGF